MPSRSDVLRLLFLLLFTLPALPRHAAYAGFVSAVSKLEVSITCDNGMTVVPPPKASDGLGLDVVRGAWVTIRDGRFPPGWVPVGMWSFEGAFSLGGKLSREARDLPLAPRSPDDGSTTNDNRSWSAPHGPLLFPVGVAGSPFARSTESAGERGDFAQYLLLCNQSHDHSGSESWIAEINFWRPFLLLVIGIVASRVVTLSNHPRTATAAEAAAAFPADSADSAGFDSQPADSPPPPLASEQMLAVGDEAILESPGGRGVWLALDDASRDAVLDAERREDLEEIAFLMAGGRMIRIPNGTRVEVIRPPDFSVHVCIRNGPHRGVEVWVRREHVRRIRTLPRPGLGFGFQNIPPAAEPRRPGAKNGGLFLIPLQFWTDPRNRTNRLVR